MILAIVTHPGNALELRWCITSFCTHARAPFSILILTERDNVEAIHEIIAPLRRFARIQVCAMAREAEEVRNHYCRQMAAKLLIPRATTCQRIVITDDDTEALQPWTPEIFFDGDCARIFYQHDPEHFWIAGTRAVFRSRSPAYRFQLRLPFAIHGETLTGLANSDIGARALAAWREAQLVSEFEIMGEYALIHDWPRSLFLTGKEQHWTTGENPVFRDWQRCRGEFRKSIRARMQAR